MKDNVFTGIILADKTECIIYRTVSGFSADNTAHFIFFRNIARLVFFPIRHEQNLVDRLAGAHCLNTVSDYFRTVEFEILFIHISAETLAVARGQDHSDVHTPSSKNFPTSSRSPIYVTFILFFMA